jgi:hypothetical protein
MDLGVGRIDWRGVRILPPTLYFARSSALIRIKWIAVVKAILRFAQDDFGGPVCHPEARRRRRIALFVEWAVILRRESAEGSLSS